MHNNNIDVARCLIDKYIKIAIGNNTGYSKRFIASVLLAENPDRFPDLESARTCVRKALNANGHIRLKCSDLASRFALMQSSVDELPNQAPFVMPGVCSRTLAIADLHSRFCDKRALSTAIEYGIKQKCDSVVIDGDYMDFYGFSRFDKSPMVLEGFYNEQEWGVDVLKLLQDCFGRVYLKKGNHDIRRQQNAEKMSVQFPELFGLASYERYLDFEGSRVQFIEDYNHIVYGKLNIIHGHEYQGGGGVHVAYNRMGKTMDNTLSAHSHKAQSVIKTNINGDIIGSWALGCLCNLHPRYNPKNDWTQGFAILEKDSTGDFEVKNRLIFGNKTFPA